MHKAFELEMVLIDDILVNKDLWKKYFCCDVDSCKGSCCHGHAEGTVVALEELQYLETIYAEISGYMSEEGCRLVRTKGIACHNGIEYKTFLQSDGLCIFAVRENGRIRCAVEKAWDDKKTDFRKPIGCEIFPVRISRLANGLTALNYTALNKCAVARELGFSRNIAVFEAARSGLIREFGEDFYSKLEKYREK